MRTIRTLLVAGLLATAAGPMSAFAQSVTVPEGGDLQAAIDRARPGDVILLAPGATYVGNFVLREKPGSHFITISTAPSEGLPRAGQRVLPSHAPRLAKIQSPNAQPAMRTEPGARHWRLLLLHFLPNANASSDIIRLGDGSSAQRDAAKIPHDLIVDRCYIHGHPERGQRRGIALNSASTTISNSYIADIKFAGQDAQAIAGWNGPGPYTIENNYLEASGENFLLGGGDPFIPGLVPSDVTFRRNHLSKPLAWRGQRWTVKNLFELKNARRVLVEANLMEHNWVHGQVGYAILLTPRNQDGRAPWSTVEDVTIRRNVVRHAGGGIQILGEDDANKSELMNRITITQNLFYGIDGREWGGPGAFVQIGSGPRNVAIEHNTISQSGNIVVVYGGTRANPRPVPGFVFRNNIVRHNRYGVHGQDRAPGRDTLDTFFPDGIFASNGVGGGSARDYPGGNIFVPDDDFDRQFVDAARGDFRLAPNSRFRGAASGGGDLGADVAAVIRAVGGRLPTR